MAGKRPLPAPATPRRRLPREQRRRQLFDVAWRIAREHGADALTLGRLAEEAGVAKPVVYAHFASRDRLLEALYLEFDARQGAVVVEALRASEPTLEARARVLADRYVECVLAQGRELPGVSAALSTSPELERFKRACQADFLAIYRDALQPFAATGDIAQAGLLGMLGAAERLSAAAAGGELPAARAKAELFHAIRDMVLRQGAGDEPGPGSRKAGPARAKARTAR